MRQPWLPYLAPNIGLRTPLLCFPHAGGSASGFLPWRTPGHPDLYVQPLQYPARETRISERMPVDVPTLVAQIADALLRFTGAPYLLYGHSWGAILAYETACELRNRGVRGPSVLAVSGCTAPHDFHVREPYHCMADEDLLEALVAFGGTSEEVRKAPDLLEVILATARADFALCAAYRPFRGPPLSASILALSGAGDPWASEAQAELWRAYTSSGFGTRVFEGGHFFHVSERLKVLESIADFARECPNVDARTA
jgi:surfactin synthase thioesterase subunit